MDKKKLFLVGYRTVSIKHVWKHAPPLPSPPENSSRLATTVVWLLCCKPRYAGGGHYCAERGSRLVYPSVLVFFCLFFGRRVLSDSCQMYLLLNLLRLGTAISVAFHRVCWFFLCLCRRGVKISCLYVHFSQYYYYQYCCSQRIMGDCVFRKILQHDMPCSWDVGRLKKKDHGLFIFLTK